MYLVQEQHGLATTLPAQDLRLLDRRTDVLDPRHHGGQRHEFRVAGSRHQPCQRRLAGARRAPEQHRMQAASLQQAAQRLAGREQVRLPDEFIE
jgi:hypothetical protein